jgi:uncharacterized protein YjbI with pentapeptide repeats
MSTSRQRSSSASSPSTKRNGKAATSPAVPPQTVVPLPAADDRDGWRAHWQAQGQPWRAEPEIDQKRQAELGQHRAIVPEIEKGIYPFKGMKLSRADVEWLLATHENGRGPVDWNDESQRELKGLDLRGADLSHVDLRNLPLSRMYGGLARNQWEWDTITSEQREAATVFLKNADLRKAQLEGAYLARAHLEKADLREAFLQEAELRATHLEDAWISKATLEGADLSRAHLERAYLREAHLAGANLSEAHLESASLREAHLEGKCVRQQQEKHLLRPADLRGAYFDQATNLEGARLGDMKHGYVPLADIRWNDASLALIRWSQIDMLGDEYEIHRTTSDGKGKDKATRLNEYESAVRSNRQIAVALQAQGLGEEAARFAYRAQVLQRRVFWFEMVQHREQLRRRARALGAWLFSWFLFLIAGYGYKPSRSFLAYLLVISGFATAYYVLGHTVGPTLSPLGAFVFSMTSFHGRGFFPGNNISLDDPLTVLAALEALVGLIIEVTFIATLTQRFFNR